MLLPRRAWLQEYVNEDLGVMKKELEQWRDEYAKRNDVRAALYALALLSAMPQFMVSQWLSRQGLRRCPATLDECGAVYPCVTIVLLLPLWVVGDGG